MIDILLATYNGEKYLRDLLHSIQNQTYKDWRLIVSDDGSSDATVEIVKKFAEMIDNPVCVYENKTGSAKNNFFSMMKYVKSEYIMFCDQDDVWLNDKISSSYCRMKQEEERLGKDTPILVATDLKVVDSQLNVINDSFYKYSSLDYNFSINKLMCQNKIPGCTIMINYALLRKNPTDLDISNISMHDSWFVLMAATFGKISFINEAKMLYRQHNSNSVGAEDVKSVKYIISKLLNINKIKQENMDRIKEVSYLYKVCGMSISNEKARECIRSYASLEACGRMKYRFICLKYGMLKCSTGGKIAQLILCHK